MATTYPRRLTGRRSSAYSFHTQDFEKRLLAKVGQLQNLSRTKAQEKVQMIVSRMRELCPVRTGKLSGSIGWVEVPIARQRIGLLGAPATIGLTSGGVVGKKRGGPLVKFRFGCIKYYVRYAVYVEYGTSLAPAQSFFRTAIAEVMHVTGPFIYTPSQGIPTGRGGGTRGTSRGILGSRASEQMYRQSPEYEPE